MSSEDTEELLAAAQARLERILPKLAGYARRLLSRSPLTDVTAEDILQDIAVLVLEKATTDAKALPVDDGKFQAWCMRAALYRVSNWRRKERSMRNAARILEIERDVVDSFEASPAETRRAVEQVKNAIKDPTDRAVIEQYMHGFPTSAEIGEALGLEGCVAYLEMLSASHALEFS